ncbi:MAG: glycosyltransferase [Hyphomicrobiales bacterium]
MFTLLALISLIAWIGLVFFRHSFWTTDQRLPVSDGLLEQWPAVVAIVPARNEQETIARCLGAIARQNYAGRLHIVLANDSSTDNTADIATGLGETALSIVNALPLEEGWAGKMWALEHGVKKAAERAPKFYWFTDADIEHGEGVLSSLVAHAEANRLGLTSLMVRLRCQNFWEKLLVPAFIYYFCLIYPFRAVNNPKSPIAGAAGGCILVRKQALEQAGGIVAVKNEVIDDCAIGRAVKRAGWPVWLGLADDSFSLRGYEKLSDFWNMVKRSAFEQLKHSYLLCAGAIAGLALTFLLPPLLALGFGLGAWPLAWLAGIAAWILMTASYLPIVRYHKLSPIWALSLPMAACLFGAMTVDSALAGLTGKSANWRGRDMKNS